MTDREQLVEQIARALAESDLRWGDASGVVRQRVDASWRDYTSLAQAVLPFIAAERERCDQTWDAGFNLAMAAGELIKATDGQDNLRQQRQAVLDALKQFEAIRSQP